LTRSSTGMPGAGRSSSSRTSSSMVPAGRDGSGWEESLGGGVPTACPGGGATTGALAGCDGAGPRERTDGGCDGPRWVRRCWSAGADGRWAQRREKRPREARKVAGMRCVVVAALALCLRSVAGREAPGRSEAFDDGGDGFAASDAEGGEAALLLLVLRSEERRVGKTE